jgi:ubiquinol-cytochrome c reductase cytochrome c subunit
MRRRTPTTAVLGLLALPVLAGVFAFFARVPRAHASDTPPPAYNHGVELAPNPRKDIPRITDPAKIYLRDCATCHGADAHGTSFGPSIEGQGRASVYFWVSTGRMPIQYADQRIARREPAYPPDVIDRLVDYVATLAGGGGPDIPHVGPGDVANGLHLFGLECASCHAWSGSGSIIYNGKVPTVVPATPAQVASAVRIGPGEMPAFGPAAFDQQQLNDLVAFVGSLKHKDDHGGYGLFHRGPTTEGAAALVLGLGAMLLAIGWIGTKARPRAVE